MINFPGWLTSIDKKTDHERVHNAVILEVTSVKKTGEIEIAFDDRNERCYIKFRLQDLAERICMQSSQEG
jgi:hypothetical protein